LLPSRFFSRAPLHFLLSLRLGLSARCFFLDSLARLLCSFSQGGFLLGSPRRLAQPAVFLRRLRCDAYARISALLECFRFGMSPLCTIEPCQNEKRFDDVGMVATKLSFSGPQQAFGQRNCLGILSCGAEFRDAPAEDFNLV
jgi:hypothetical protein